MMQMMIIHQVSEYLYIFIDCLIIFIVCWSPKGKQIVAVTYDGALLLYDQNMILKKRYSSVAVDSLLPPCISVLWISTHHFLLGFSENSPDENPNDNSFFHVMVTYEKDQEPKAQIYNDLFFDASQAPVDMNSQYFYARLNHRYRIDLFFLYAFHLNNSVKLSCVVIQNH
jgi:hypothetical protein